MKVLSAIVLCLVVLQSAGCGKLKSEVDSMMGKKETAVSVPPSEAPKEVREPSGSPSPSLAGVYDVRGTNPGGTGNYTGTAMISQTGNSYRIDWSVGTAYTGTGTREGNTLNIAWGDGTNVVGTVKYNVESDGRLTGIWFMHTNPDNLGSEILIPRR